MRPSPFYGLVSVLADLLAGDPGGVPEGVGRGFRSVGGSLAELVAAPLRVPRPSLPDCLTLGAGWDDDRGVDGVLDHMRTCAPARLAPQLLAAYGPTVPTYWRAAVDHPQRWIDAWVALLRALWTHSYGQAWQRAAGVVDREVDRVARAAVGGGLPVLLSQLHPDVSWSGSTLVVSNTRHADLHDPVLELIPLVAGAQMFADGFPDDARLGYSVPGLGTVLRLGQAPPMPDPLPALVGLRRATALRSLERQAMSNQRLAAVLECSPSSVTYHLSLLVDADLVTRERRGKEVVHRLTDRGHLLLSTYPAPRGSQLGDVR